ncbi:hypothetical protein [Marasmitruncus massiliensis]|uniref:hypothetical protein n=1 Tax=Marasmitruncus massiliensis TaxID=1944642 RepID=UPI000C7DDF1C|nr:hypothetical protein [Marasmitruncus massiliensis]
MAKTIKFNLICNGNPVRTLDDLRNNFSIEDVLEYYKNQLLQRWLTVRGYSEELKKLESIKESEDLPLIKALIDLFEVEVDSSVIEKDTYILGYKKESEFLAKEYEIQSYKISSIISDYHSEYQQLVATIIENKNDIAKIKAAVKTIDENYHAIYELDYRTLFNISLLYAPMTIFVMLMRENMRNKYLPANDDKIANYSKLSNNNTYYADSMTSLNGIFSRILKVTEEIASRDIDAERLENTQSQTDAKMRAYLKNDCYVMYAAIIELTKSYSELKEILGDNLCEFAGVTDGYWKDVEPKGKRYLILKMEPGNFIRSAGESRGDLDSSVIKNRFVILDGIDYKSNNTNDKLLYMEV